ncbi:coiled-coil-helix-coiled-coil-helix domain-containing protein 1 isoform X1 [Sus scrofa]|uniref:Coiled-coil-helix-coiled-coil-helix domain containing 1 n=2 Tax=Sus scrofa TaxID=9823 RepID=A0A8D1R1K9_PIG|nr:coiled-coil-helix-coiled-coil-helix domain-containing protein 1 isoform X1 [Sus scrofa]
MATPSLRGRLARLGNPRRPILKPNKPLILANHVGERRREKGEATCITEMSVMMACWKQNEFRDEACRKEIQDFFDCASRAEVTGGSWGALLGGEWGIQYGSYCLLLGDKKILLPQKGREKFLGST